MPHIQGSQEQMKAFMEMDIEGPIHMLNQLRYKEDGGRESYKAYSKNTLPLIEKHGGKLIYRARAKKTVIGSEVWDDVFIVEYPSKSAFFDMIQSDEYQEGVNLRHEALEDSRLVCMQGGEGKLT